MANPFDFNEDEASRMFEKSVIFGGGTSPMDNEARSFMKSSLAAANMLPGDEDDDISSITTRASSVCMYFRLISTR